MSEQTTWADAAILIGVAMFFPMMLALGFTEEIADAVVRIIKAWKAK